MTVEALDFGAQRRPRVVTSVRWVWRAARWAGDHWYWAALAAIIGFFMYLYGTVILALPLFGDAANHARIARSFAEEGFWNTLTPYPPLYHLAGSVGFLVAGEAGFQTLTIVSLALLGITVFLFSREVTRSATVGVLAALFVLMSPEILFFSVRMYMEIALAASVVFALYAAHRYFRLRTQGSLILLAVSVGVAALIKQQGLVLLAPAVGLYLLGEAAFFRWRASRLRASLSARHALLYLAVIAAVAGPATLWQFRTTGHVLPDTEYTAWMNDAGQWLVRYDQELPAWRQEWDPQLDAFFFDTGYAERGYERAEARHIWPQDVITTPRGFFGIHTLYWYGHLSEWQFPQAATTVILGLAALGLGVWAWRSRREPFFWFLIVFLLINYIAFVRNNDQVRYHLYIAVALTFAIPYGARVLAERWKAVSVGVLVALAVAGAALTFTYLPDRADKARHFANSQAYAPSVGGIASVEEVGMWLDEHLAPDDTYFAVPTTEFDYYSGRDGVFDYRIYFLPQETLAALFADMGVKYIVIPDSAVVEDERWNHILWVPVSFVDKLRELYPLAYRGSFDDISVFEVRP